MVKESCNLIEDDKLHAKNKDINWFLPEILMIKESYNLIGQKAQLATRAQKISSRMLPSIANYLPAKIFRLLDFFQTYWWSKIPEIF